MGKRIGNLNLVNYRDHPADDNYKILNFNSEAESDMFERLLKERNLWHEKDVEMHNNEPLYLFAVRNRDFDKVQRVNFEVNAAFRSPMIKNKYGQYALIAFLIGIVTLAIVSYVKSGN